VLAVVGLVVGLALDRGSGRALPAVPSTPRTAVDAMCAAMADAVWPQVGSQLEPDQMLEVALCPDDPTEDSWSTRPTSTLSGPAVQFFRLGKSGGGPPVEQCPQRIDLPGFTYLARTKDGWLVKFDYPPHSCDGLFSVHSYYMALAEAQAAAGRSPADPDGVCPMLNVVPRPLAPEDIVVCVHPVLSPSYVELVPTYRPVHAVRVHGADLAQVALGLAQSTQLGPADERDCPYVRADVIIWRGSGKDNAQVLTCEFNGSRGRATDVTWTTFPTSAQRIIENAIRTAGYPTSGR
jgi:hypothetical protein